MSLELPENLKKIVDYFSRFPGIGEKSALRHTLSFIKWDNASITDFANSLSAVTDLQTCSECGLFSDDDLCPICSDDVRKNARLVCVVESVADAFAIEKSGAFRGKYHILGGVLNPLMGIGPDDLTIDKLLMRIKDGGVEEIILALNPSVEGDVTSSYIRDIVTNGVKVKKLGLGIPMGGSLEYLDALTINKALEYGKYY